MFDLQSKHHFYGVENGGEEEKRSGGGAHCFCLIKLHYFVFWVVKKKSSICHLGINIIR